ncbi:hypothetical protein Plhal304r1_c010g0039691 [Plasmopara halstedii]
MYVSEHLPEFCSNVTIFIKNYKLPNEMVGSGKVGAGRKSSALVAFMSAYFSFRLNKRMG